MYKMSSLSLPATPELNKFIIFVIKLQERDTVIQMGSE